MINHYHHSVLFIFLLPFVGVCGIGLLLQGFFIFDMGEDTLVKVIEFYLFVSMLKLNVHQPIICKIK